MNDDVNTKTTLPQQHIKFLYFQQWHLGISLLQIGKSKEKEGGVGECKLKENISQNNLKGMKTKI